MQTNDFERRNQEQHDRYVDLLYKIFLEYGFEKLYKKFIYGGRGHGENDILVLDNGHAFYIEVKTNKTKKAKYQAKCQLKKWVNNATLNDMEKHCFIYYGIKNELVEFRYTS